MADRRKLLINKKAIRRIISSYESFLEKVFRVSESGDVFFLVHISGREDLILIAFSIAKMYAYLEDLADSPSFNAEDLQDLPFDIERIRQTLNNLLHPTERLLIQTSKGYAANPLPKKFKELLEFLKSDIKSATTG